MSEIKRIFVQDWLRYLNIHNSQLLKLQELRCVPIEQHVELLMILL